MNVDRIKRAWRTFEGYDAAEKAEYKSAGMAFFRAWMKAAGVQAKLTYNPGGVAVTGDVKLTGNGWECYIVHGTTEPILVRTSVGNRSGANNWLSFERFIDWRPEHLGPHRPF